MSNHRLWTIVLVLATMSHAAWKTLRDASNGWVGELQLVSSDSADQTLAFPEFAVPWDATPTVRATFLTAGDTQGTAVTAKPSFVNWSGARILHLNLSLSATQRHVQNLSEHRVRLTLSWKGSSGAALLPIVRNTILNPRGGSRFGKFSVASRASSGSLPQLFVASQPTLVLDIGRLAKRYRLSATSIAGWNDTKTSAAFKAGQSVVLYLPLQVKTGAVSGRVRQAKASHNDSSRNSKSAKSTKSGKSSKAQAAKVAGKKSAEKRRAKKAAGL